ncbi:MAG: hypothetical protein ACXW1R_04405 [Halobacteriota archaeon]
MPAVNWNVFTQLPGAAESNFEKLCRALVRRHYGQFGEFKELANQAGVEFHLKLQKPCDQGNPPRWYGWQCKWYQSTSGQKLGITRRNKIIDGLNKTRDHLPGLTDWILWTRYTLPKEDQTWFYGLKFQFPGFNLDLKTAADIDDLLAGPAILLRETYFGELIITPQLLVEQHDLASAPFRRRYQPDVHHVVPVEETLGQYLGGQAAWDTLPRLARLLNTEADDIAGTVSSFPKPLHTQVDSLIDHGRQTANLLDEIYHALGVGDLDAIKQLLVTDIGSPSPYRRLLAKLRAARAECALTGANLVADIYGASSKFSQLRESVAARVVAVLAPAGDGKSELAMKMTRPAGDFPGGVLLCGKDLHAGQNLDHLVGTFKIAGKPVQTFERLAEALDAAGQRSGRRLPIIIDGLNEAEDPRNWKDPLYRAEELLRNFPYVLLIITLRNEFDKDCLSENVKKLKLNGFKDAPQAAINRYFAYYKIDATDADLPLELLQHPLTLRIYCEVANPVRQHRVGVEALPRSLTALFEEHFRKVAERVADLSPSSRRIYQEEVLEALLKIAEHLWQENSRSVEVGKARACINDAQDWNSSLLRSLESEGVLVRTSRSNGQFGVAFAYDLMAGHMIAKHLLYQDDIEQWLKEPSNPAKLTFRDPGAHTLAYDTFHALVGLFPAHTHRRRQLWQAVPGKLSLYALLLTAESDPTHINRETAERFEQEMLQSTAFAQAAFPLLRVTRAAHAHPFDANFLDQVLRAMPNVDRDLSWSEWLRKNEEEVIKDIKALESWWESGTLDRREMSRARWVMWTLTTNSRYLRDVSTKALYTLALRTPAEYFELAFESLTISDPYVPERALAAAYGAALSTWSDKNNQKMRHAALPMAAKTLLRISFVPAAPAPTRHTLLRQYCLGIIELARWIDPSCVSSEEANYLYPPYSHLPSPFFDSPHATEEQIKKADKAAISMDFGNYTFDRLIPDRRNYDFDNLGYVAMRKAIVARMVDLGYDPDRFDPIERDLRSYSRGHESRKVDRYGKKYGWIAFFEMWGWRSDNNLLPDWRSEHRTSDTDIDPTFPIKEKSWSPTLPDLFTSFPDKIADWIPDGPTPDYSNLLERSEVDDNKVGNWVLLNGFVEETAKTDYRQVFTFLRGVFVRKAHVARLLKTFEVMQYPGNDAIPQEPEHYYTYAGEMPFEVPPGFPEKSKNAENLNEMQCEVGENRWSKGGVPVEIPVQLYSWESYHSELNKASCISLPSPKLCQYLGLGYRPNQWDLHDDLGVASLYRELGTEDISLSGRLAYLRADLLQRYLDETDQALVWLMWGERGQHYRGHSSGNKELHHLYADHKHIHKRSAVWQNDENIVK